LSSKEINRTIEWIDQEIREQQTGTPNQLAGKLKNVCPLVVLLPGHDEAIGGTH